MTSSEIADALMRRLERVSLAHDDGETRPDEIAAIRRDMVDAWGDMTGDDARRVYARVEDVERADLIRHGDLTPAQRDLLAKLLSGREITASDDDLDAFGRWRMLDIHDRDPLARMQTRYVSAKAYIVRMRDA